MEFNEAFESLVLKFKSGNEIPVTQATITLGEFEAIAGKIKSASLLNPETESKIAHDDVSNVGC